MAKSGRYAAQRRKVENLGTTATTIQVHDCGTEFLVNQNGTAAVEHTLPAVGAAGEGWWCAFTLKTAVTNADADIKISSTAANIIGIEVSDAAGEIHSAAVTSIVMEGNSAKVGTRVELWCDGTNYYALTFAHDNADITKV
tara:strand:- start:43 stop:465 length:423 start_codon:yes stop_codon:yes gene_type:complete